MAGTAYQGTQIKMNVQGEDNYLNVDMDATLNFLSYQWNWNQPNPPPMEERFSRYLNNDSSIIFTEEKTETNAETFFVHIVYKLTK
jgi:hypothetical protein